MNGLVTVIVPVYKTSKFLKKSILSIVHQTYKNLEIILIDDGSPDSCPKICDSLSKKDCRIRVLHQKNSGVSRARNAGISISNGEYICFVDSDDWLPNESIERLVLNMEKNHSDFCYGGIEEIGTINTNYRGVSQEAVCDVEDSKQLISFLKHLKTVAGPWGKMYRRDIIKKNSIFFPEDIAYAEDRIFLWNYIQHCSRISSFPQNVYFYSNLNANNACSKYYPKYNLWMKTTIDMYSQIFKSFDKETESEINRSAFKLLNDSIIRYSLAEIDEATSINYIEKTISLFQTYISKMRIGRNWFLFLLIINLFQVLFLAPYKTETGDVYVLGLRITFTLYCYVTIFFSIAYDYYKKENYRISGTTLFSIVLAVITLLTQMVATGLIGLLAIFIAYCILKKEKNYWLLILIAILATYGTVFQADYIQAFGSFFKIFGKDLTFSSRTYIWKRALELIPLKMFMGYGTTDFFIPAFGGVDHPAHNEVLNVLYRGGLCSFVFIFSAFILIVKSSTGKTPWNRVCMALLFGMVIVMITEILSAQNSYHFILSLCYFINTVWNDKKTYQYSYVVKALS